MTDYKATEFALDKAMQEIEENTSSVFPASTVSWPILNEKAYYGIAGELVRIIEPQSESDPIAILVNFLTAFGSVVGNNAYVKIEASKHATRLFTTLVGKTAKSRKGTSVNYIKYIFGELDPIWNQNIQSGLSSGEGLIWAVRNEIIKKEPIKEKGRIVGYQEVIVDSGVSDKRCLVIETEFVSALIVCSREGSTLSPVIRNAWDSGDLQILTKNSPAKSTNAHISIIGNITQEELLKNLNEIEAANGFGNRFLWFCVKRSKELPFGGNLHLDDLKPVIEKIKLAVDFAKQVQEVTWAEETKPLWKDVYSQLSQDTPGIIGSMTARAEANTLRLAEIYALLDCSKLILPVHVEAALAVFKYAEDSIKYLFQDKTGDPLADSILESLRNNPQGMTRTSISESFSRHKSANKISSSLQLLLTLSLAKKETISTSGRPIEIWKIS